MINDQALVSCVGYTCGFTMGSWFAVVQVIGDVGDWGQAHGCPCTLQRPDWLELAIPV